MSQTLASQVFEADDLLLLDNETLNGINMLNDDNHLIDYKDLTESFSKFTNTGSFTGNNYGISSNSCSNTTSPSVIDKISSNNDSISTADSSTTMTPVGFSTKNNKVDLNFSEFIDTLDQSDFNVNKFSYEDNSVTSNDKSSKFANQVENLFNEYEFVLNDRFEDTGSGSPLYDRRNSEVVSNINQNSNKYTRGSISYNVDTWNFDSLNSVPERSSDPSSNTYNGNMNNTFLSQPLQSEVSQVLNNFALNFGSNNKATINSNRFSLPVIEDSVSFSTDSPFSFNELFDKDNFNPSNLQFNQKPNNVIAGQRRKSCVSPTSPQSGNSTIATSSRHNSIVGNNSQFVDQYVVPSLTASPAARLAASNVVLESNRRASTNSVKTRMNAKSRRRKSSAKANNSEVSKILSQNSVSNIVKNLTASKRNSSISINSNDEIEKPFKCGDCTKQFRRSEHLKRHIRSVHSKERPFPCKYCDKKFSRSDNLSQHLKTHKKHGDF
ncbi:hypothetical protein Kpol_1013p21 [Vanderwaltozyma polyspora DSM 70294]|uniref:C2H2-type domain-containing protein n=1 Tax=Vanderwaltozyma polyspora (strain ATCC 22028 / DSM 70294 / BCRC 21397 / CBS 2163 / NBRC 10782 / NRRL Y-8283 / UCD 57-17) TaxID=436907 RepID=A7TH69_VANPO|nr:uncharacterized protein Kpol_1013p21 [Vanderwaltozyma polyspora DSM 70294]EDO18350.1 hypothetical protein Kpol_1013p21 [Vanderwaltozyma polyspora DSM 70294]